MFSGASYGSIGQGSAGWGRSKASRERMPPACCSPLPGSRWPPTRGALTHGQPCAAYKKSCKMQRRRVISTPSPAASSEWFHGRRSAGWGRSKPSRERMPPTCCFRERHPPSGPIQGKCDHRVSRSGIYLRKRNVKSHYWSGSLKLCHKSARPATSFLLRPTKASFRFPRG